jgi:hypothetical protein
VAVVTLGACAASQTRPSHLVDLTHTLSPSLYSSMANTQVENCVLQAVRRWDFPKPKDGGPVVIVYPFQFNS